MRKLQTHWLLMLSVYLPAATQSAIAAGFADITITARASGAEKTEEDQANGLPSQVAVSAYGTSSFEPPGGYSCTGQGSGSTSVVGNDRMIIADMSIHGRASGNQRCFNLGWGPPGSSAMTTINAKSSEPVYFTGGSSAQGGMVGGLFEQFELARSEDGGFEHAFGAQATNFQLYSYSGDAIGVWSLGHPGTAELPFLSFPSVDVQRFVAPTPGSSVEEGGLGHFAPFVDPNYLIEGFDLAGADGNRFSAFRFPDVPTGSDNRFTLMAGSSVVTGLAGQTIDLSQYSPEGFEALSLRGNLTPFLMAAAMPDAATPIGRPPTLTFGLTFVELGIARFTLRPVPEPAALRLALTGVLVFAVARRRASRCPTAGVPLEY